MLCFCTETTEIWKTEALRFQKEEETEQKCSQRSGLRGEKKKKKIKKVKTGQKTLEVREDPGVLRDARTQMPGDAQDGP